MENSEMTGDDEKNNVKLTHSQANAEIQFVSSCV
jgi:hypothetical protein